MDTGFGIYGTLNGALRRHGLRPRPGRQFRSAPCLGNQAVRADGRFLAVPNGIWRLVSIGRRCLNRTRLYRLVRRDHDVLFLSPPSHHRRTVYPGAPPESRTGYSLWSSNGALGCKRLHSLRDVELHHSQLGPEDDQRRHGNVALGIHQAISQLQMIGFVRIIARPKLGDGLPPTSRHEPHQCKIRHDFRVEAWRSAVPRHAGNEEERRVRRPSLVEGPAQ
jgi:hypothetical protein